MFTYIYIRIYTYVYTCTYVNQTGIQYMMKHTRTCMQGERLNSLSGIEQARQTAGQGTFIDAAIALLISSSSWPWVDDSTYNLTGIPTGRPLPRTGMI